MHRLEIQIDWAAFVEGDEEVFRQVYDIFFEVLYNYGCKFTSNKELVEDAIQELFVRFWKSRDRLNEPPSLKNYLLKAFRNHMSDRLKAEGRYIADELGEQHMFTLVPSPEQVQVVGEQSAAVTERIDKALGSLSDRQREAIYLRFYEEYSYVDIAGIMGITVKATYKLMARAIDAMREHLGGSDLHILLILMTKGLKLNTK